MVAVQQASSSGPVLHRPAPLVVTCERPRTEDDHAYIRSSWAESHKLSPANAILSWRVYKKLVKPELQAVLDRADTQLIAAYHAGTIVGWIAFVPGRRVSTVHWVHTRWRIGEGEPLRKRGVMAELFSAAPLGSRIVYTFRGPLPAHRKHGKQTSDEWIVPWLARRGVTAAYLPLDEWAK